MSIDMQRLSVSQLIAIYNHHTPAKVTRFESHTAGVSRLNKLLAKIEISLEDAYHAAFPATRRANGNPAKGGAAAAKDKPSPALGAVELPNAPDFTANTHKPYRAKLARLVELAQAGDIAGLDAVEIKPSSSSPKALIRYRNQVVAALQARQEA
jgi:hypothetical protein